MCHDCSLPPATTPPLTPLKGEPYKQVIKRVTKLQSYLLRLRLQLPPTPSHTQGASPATVMLLVVYGPPPLGCTYGPGFVGISCPTHGSREAGTQRRRDAGRFGENKAPDPLHVAEVVDKQNHVGVDEVHNKSKHVEVRCDPAIVTKFARTLNSPNSSESPNTSNS